jgi:hypothetical protein
VAGRPRPVAAPRAADQTIALRTRRTVDRRRRRDARDAERNGLERQATERLGLTDRLSFGEVGPEETVLQSALQTVLTRQVQQAVGVEAVAALGLVKAEVEPFLGGHGRQVRL